MSEMDFHAEADSLFHGELNFARDENDPEMDEMLLIIERALKRMYEAGRATASDSAPPKEAS